MFRLGELDERVTLRSYTEAKDECGTLTATPDDFATVWAHVRPMSGRERDRAQQTEARTNYLVVIHYRDDVTHSQVVVWRSQVLNIRFIKNHGPRSHLLELECELGAAPAAS